MNFAFLTFACFIVLACAEDPTEAPTQPPTQPTTTTTTEAPVTKNDGSIRKVRPTKEIFENVHLYNTETECIQHNGKWVTMTLTDEGGDNGIQLDLVKVSDQVAVKSISTPISSGRDRRLSRRGDVITFEESFCLDYLGKDFAPCYDIVTSSQGQNPEELSWSVKVSALRRATEEELARGEVDKVMEAIKEGAVFDSVKVLCGRLYKQIGRFTDRQVAKLHEDLALDKNDVYRKQKEGDRLLRMAAKVAQKAEELNLVAAD